MCIGLCTNSLLRPPQRYEGARAEVASLLGAATDEVVFVRGTTEGPNLAATVLGEARVQPGDSILVTETEHHANLIP